MILNIFFCLIICSNYLILKNHLIAFSKIETILTSLKIKNHKNLKVFQYLTKIKCKEDIIQIHNIKNCIKKLDFYKQKIKD